MTSASSSALPRACLRPLQQPPLDSITIYNTATHCYLLATDSLQRDFHLMTCRKHSIEDAVMTARSANASTTNTTSEVDEDERSGWSASGTPSRPQEATFCCLDDLHDYTSYAVYSPTEAASLDEALQREHGASMHVIGAVALIGAVRFTEGYYLVLITERRVAGYLGAHRLFEASQVELVSLLLDSEWVAAQARAQRQVRRSGEMEGLASFAGGSSGSGSGAGPAFHRKPQASSYRKSSSSATAAAAYLFQRRPLEELYRQQFLSSLSRASSFFYSHSYDLTNTLQRNTLAEGAAAHAADAQSPGEKTKRGCKGSFSQSDTTPHLDSLHEPRMQYVWNEYLLEPWQLLSRDDYDEALRGPGVSVSGYGEEAAAQRGLFPHRVPVPHYPASFARWRTFVIHGYITQRTVVVRRPAFHTLLITLIARVSKAAAGVRYLRRGINSDGQAANHVEVEQIVSDEGAWNQLFTEGAMSSYVQLRGSVPVRWYHPPTASRLLPKPPIVIGPCDAEWSTTCLHFQELLRQYGGPILAHDLLKRKEHNTRESAVGDAYRAAAQALAAAVARGTAQVPHDEQNSDDAADGSLCCADVFQYESTDLRDLGPLAWNNMTACAEHHFDQVHCFVCRRQQAKTAEAECSTSSVSSAAGAATGAAAPSSPTRDYAIGEEDCPAVAVQIQCGVVRSNCLDCIDRTNLGQLFHGLHALGEQLCGLGLLHHAADLRDSPVVTELLLDMYLAMGDALATQYGGSAQVGAGVLHRGAGWDQLMGVKRLYNNVMGDRDKQEAIKLLLGRTQPHPRQYSRARNASMQTPGQTLPLAVSTSLSGAPSLSTSMTAASPGLAGAAARVSESNRSFGSFNSESALVPASSASSLFSGLLQAASRWWGDATGSSSASSTAAALEALRAAQYAAAEAEAEPDYYENVSAGPRLPPAELLATWWVQPLKEFAAWYAACGISVRGKSLRGARMSVRGNKENAETSREAEETLLFSSLLRNSPASSTTAITTATSMTSRPSRVATPAAVLSDAFAQHLLAADNEAQQRWLLYVARWERQMCLALPQRAGGVAGVTASAAVVAGRDGVPGQSSRAAGASVGDVKVALDRGGSGAFVGAAAAATTGSVLRPSVSTWGMDDAAIAVNATLSDSEATPFGESALPDQGVSADEPSSPFAPFSLTLAPSLFVEPWIVLRTTAHVLAVPGSSWCTDFVKSAAFSGSFSPTVNRSGEAPDLLSDPLRLLYAWRDGKGLDSAMPASNLSEPRSVKWKRHETQWPVDKPIAFSIMRQLFGFVAPELSAMVTAGAANAASTASWSQKMWRCPEEPHDHQTFPRVVRESVFARQEAALDQLACCETMWIADASCGAKKSSTESMGQTHRTETPPGQADAARRDAVHGAAQQSKPDHQPHQQQQLNAWQAASVTQSYAAVEDGQFVAALLSDLYEAPEMWGVEQVILALQRLLFPAPLPQTVQRTLHHADVQPPLSGAELLSPTASWKGKGGDSTLEYWRLRLGGTAGQAAKGKAASSSAAQQLQKAARCQGEEAEAVETAALLLSRLSLILCSAHPATRDAPCDERRDQTPPPATQAPLPLLASRGAALLPEKRVTASRPLAIVDALGEGCEPVLSQDAASEAALVAAVAPLLESDSADVSAEVRCQLLSPDHPSLSEAMRRLWLLCRLLQPLLSPCVLSPGLLPDTLRALFCEVPQALSACDCVASPFALHVPHHTRHHVRYTFALSPQVHAAQQQEQQRQPHQGQQVRSQLAAGALAGTRGSNNNNNSEGEGGRVNNATLSSALSSSPSAATVSVTGGATPPSMHIPATVEVKFCCTSLELYRWCVQHRTRSRRAHAEGRLHLWTLPSVLCGAAGDVPPSQRPQFLSTSRCGVVDEDAAEASWRLLWWAVENNLVVPVVRQREHAALEILADETALFCVVEDVSRVALNVERRGRGEVWRHTRQPPSPSQSDTPVDWCLGNGGSSAIYGTSFASSSFPVHRLTRRSALMDMMALSESLASLGLSAATRVQEFFRDYVLHGWTKTSLKSGGASPARSSYATSSAGATVAIFGGGPLSAAALGGGGDGGSSRSASGAGMRSGADASPAIEAAIAVSPSEVVLHFSQLAEECLRSIQSVMVALQFVSLDALADDHALHSYISFFVNIYNTAYVVAWLTNVKELTAYAALASAKLKGATATAARSDRHFGATSGVMLRSIDLLSLPTLCNTNIACFMHVYGVAIGHVFVSLEEIKYGVLGGNRAPPYRDAPLWSSPNEVTPPSLHHQPSGNNSSSTTTATTRAVPPTPPTVLHNALQSRETLQRQVPPHLRVAIPEAARLASLQQHPQVRAAVNWRELCDVYGHKTTSAEESTGRQPGMRRSDTKASSFPASVNHLSSIAERASSVSMTNVAMLSPVSSVPSQPTTTSASAPIEVIRPVDPSYKQEGLFSATPAFEAQRRRYCELVDAWSADVVRHVHIRTSLQLIDLYLPPPLFHLCHTTEGSRVHGDDGSNGGGGGGFTSGDSGSAGGYSRCPSLDTRFRLDMDGERVPWYLQPILNTMPLVHPTLQSSRLGVVYGVAGDSDGRASGTLLPRVSPDANGVLLQPCRMWSSPSYYLVGGDGVNDEEAIAHSYQLLQSLSGSYLGVNGYRTGESNGPVLQHLCSPLHHEDVLAQLHTTEVTFRSALRSTDPHMFQDAHLSSSSPVPVKHGPSYRMEGHLGLSSTSSCSAALHNAMKPLLYEWCRTTDDGMESISLLAKPGSQLRVLLKILRLLDESYVSGEAVRHRQLAVR